MSDSVRDLGQAGTFLRIENRCYAAANGNRGDTVQRVNLLQYFELSQALGNAKRTLSFEKAKVGTIYFGGLQIVDPLRKFISTNDGFNSCKHVANAILEAMQEFNSRYLMKPGSEELDFDKIDTDVASWEWGRITREIDAFIAVFTAECRDLEMYSVGQIGIYNMNSLVNRGSERFAAEHKLHMPAEALEEFDNAGRCLAFNLPTACGFHSIRGLELCLLSYIGNRSAKVEKLRSWNDYHNEIEKLAKDLPEPRKPSAKIAPMIQRMKELDRNPLMHPRDNLDISGADQLFNLAAITAVELAKDDAALAAAVSALPPPANEDDREEQADTAAA